MIICNSLNKINFYRLFFIAALINFLLIFSIKNVSLSREIDDAADLATQQAQEKDELSDMKEEMNRLKSNMQNALEDLGTVQKQMSGKGVKEFHIQAKELAWEILPGCSVNAYGYNGQMPGPIIKVAEGDQVKIVLHNAMRASTSLLFHGLQLPFNVNGLPRKGSGLLASGDTYVYQFIAEKPGTYFYHPQVTHLEQMNRGLVGALVVEPRRLPKTYEKDFVLIISEMTNNSINSASNLKSANSKPQGFTGIVTLLNGKSAPAIPALELKQGERIRLRLINIGSNICPITLSGHKFEIVSQNGSESTEPHVYRDSISVGPGERLDVEFTADNPGVWSFFSMNPAQSSFNGQFPGGIAMVVRYAEAKNNLN